MLKEEILAAAKDMIDRYPKIRLIDIYKSFYQDEFGPGHMLIDKDIARRYFEDELGIMKNRRRYDIERCGTGNNFYRADMDIVAGGIIGADDYFNNFVEGSKYFKMPEIGEWQYSWHTILKIIEDLVKEREGFAGDKMTIECLLKNGEATINHSDVFIKEYDPHYRIMSVKIAVLFANMVQRHLTPTSRCERN